VLDFKDRGKRRGFHVLTSEIHGGKGRVGKKKGKKRTLTSRKCVGGGGGGERRNDVTVYKGEASFPSFREKSKP